MVVVGNKCELSRGSLGTTRAVETWELHAEVSAWCLAPDLGTTQVGGRQGELWLLGGVGAAQHQRRGDVSQTVHARSTAD